MEETKLPTSKQKRLEDNKLLTGLMDGQLLMFKKLAIMEKRMCGLNTGGITPQMVMRSLDDDIPELLACYR